MYSVATFFFTPHSDLRCIHIDTFVHVTGLLEYSTLTHPFLY